MISLKKLSIITVCIIAGTAIAPRQASAAITWDWNFVGNSGTFQTDGTQEDLKKADLVQPQKFTINANTVQLKSSQFFSHANGVIFNESVPGVSTQDSKAFLWNGNASQDFFTTSASNNSFLYDGATFVGSGYYLNFYGTSDTPQGDQAKLSSFQNYRYPDAYVGGNLSLSPEKTTGTRPNVPEHWGGYEIFGALLFGAFLKNQYGKKKRYFTNTEFLGTIS